jgi:N-alpha-acetyltransferase 15/16, NatA auxiliary subunit
MSVEGMSASERKKAMRKARKAELKSGGGDSVSTETTAPAVNGNTASTNSSAASNNAVGPDGKKKDDDPDGLKLVNSGTLMVDVIKFLRPLLEVTSGKDILVYILACEVYIRRSMNSFFLDRGFCYLFIV